jgi:hypothetical protein
LEYIYVPDLVLFELEFLDMVVLILDADHEGERDAGHATCGREDHVKSNEK